MSAGSRRRPVVTATGVAALAALAVSLGIHPATALEVAAGVSVLLLTAALVRLVPRSVRRAAPPRGGGRTDVWSRAQELVSGSLRSRWWVDTALRPVVREVVEARLAAGGRSLPGDPEALRRLVPPDVVDLVLRAGRGEGRDGLTPVQLATLLDHLEELSP